MLFILGWLIYAIIVGSLAKWLHPGEDPIGFLPTIGIGIAGSFIGGFLGWMMGSNDEPFGASGLLMGTIGGILFCWGYRRYKINRFVQIQGRMPQMKK